MAKESGIEGVAEIELENMKLTLISRLSKHFTQDAQVSTGFLTRWAEDAVDVQIVQHIFGKQILHQEVSYPADWKEAFKERWYPAWAKDKWPVRYTTKTFDVREVVPSLGIPDHESFIITTLT